MGNTILFEYAHEAKAVPQTDVALLFPSKLAGGAPGKIAKKLGTNISPPPPTTASTKPARPEARAIKIKLAMSTGENI
jgi:hypothetical protein